MTNTSDIHYAKQVHLNLPYEQAVAKVIARLKEEGFGVLTEIDVKATLKQKLDADFRKYTILGACNPPLAYQALQADLSVGLLLPCNVVVYEEREGSIVMALDPIAMIGVAGNPDLDAIAEDAKQRLDRVVQALDVDSL